MLRIKLFIKLQRCFSNSDSPEWPAIKELALTGDPKAFQLLLVRHMELFIVALANGQERFSKLFAFLPSSDLIVS